MSKIFVTSAIMFAISLGQILGQTTTTTTQSQNQNGKTETYTRTETQQADGRTITTTTHTTTVNMKAFFGVKANANLSNFIIRDVENCQSKMGFGVSTGVFLKLESRNFALQYELLLHYKTSKLKDDISQTETDYQLWKLELPIYLMGQINTGAGKIFIGAGPFVNLGLDAKQSPGNIDLYKKDNTIGKSIMQRWDFGPGIMVGYELKNGIAINANYQIGLINALSAEKDNMSLKNQMVSLGIGYKF
jgi:hypothetical protein